MLLYFLFDDYFEISLYGLGISHGIYYLEISFYSPSVKYSQHLDLFIKFIDLLKVYDLVSKISFDFNFFSNKNF